MAEYQSWPEISKHGLDLINRAPAVYKYGKRPDSDSPVFRWGRLAHTAILEPHTLNVVSEEIDRRTKAGKERYAEIQASGADLVSPEEFAQLTAMRSAFEAHSVSGKLEIEDVELSCLARLFGCDVRCRPDAVTAGGLIVDLKTTQNASERAFTSDAWKYRYHVQAAFYVDVLRACNVDVEGFLFVAIEKESPYLVQCFRASEQFLERGRREYQEDLATYRECLDSGNWPGLSEDVVTLNLPSWA